MIPCRWGSELSQLILDVPDDSVLSLKLSDEAAVADIRLAAPLPEPNSTPRAAMRHIHTCTSRPNLSPMTWQANFSSLHFVASLSLVPTSQPGAKGSVCFQSPGFIG